jgi:hypothetical protein
MSTTDQVKYLDHQATTRVDPQVLDAMMPYLASCHRQRQHASSIWINSIGTRPSKTPQTRPARSRPAVRAPTSRLLPNAAR